MRAYVRPYATEAEDCAGNAYPVSEGGPLVIYQVFIAICLATMAPKGSQSGLVSWASERLARASAVTSRDPASEKRRRDIAPADMVRRIVHRGHSPRRHVDVRDGERVEPAGTRDDRRARCLGRVTARVGEEHLESAAVEIP